MAAMIKLKRLNTRLDWLPKSKIPTLPDSYKVIHNVEVRLVFLKQLRGFLIREYSFMYAPLGWLEND